jgi:hypothetical protein
MDRYWLITWTCYGHWLPGDRRGFVGNVRDEQGAQVLHTVPGTPYDEDLPRLEAWVRTQMTGPPVQLSQPEAVYAQRRMMTSEPTVNRSYRSATSWSFSRMQPRETARPTDSGSIVPCMP